MPPATIPHDEESRLAALAQQGILDTQDEAEFDALTRLAAELCNAPIALISLVDRDRLWFKSRIGLDVTEIPRDLGFCAHAILGEGTVEIADTLADQRFADNPLVTGPPGVRFYAAALLRDHEGHALGTLCVIDRSPRRLGSAQRIGLQALARQVISHMQIRRTLLQIEESVPHGPSGAIDPETTTIDAVRPRSRHVSTVPRRLGRFVVLDAIGHGAMATVYAAFDEELQRKIAVKLIHPSPDLEDQLAVQREAQTLARVSHPNVVQVHDVGMLGGQAFIAMEYIAGVTLTVWQQAQPRGLGELLAMYVQTGRGLVAAHAAGVVHRDFKPDNVLIGVDGRPRVVDFGLARTLAAQDRRTGDVVGTPAYMAPEQHDGALVDERADQFSFCAALYEALYDVRPFPGGSLAEIRVHAIAGRIQEPPPSRRAPPTVHDALVRGLARDPDHRWPSLANLLDHFDRYDPMRDAALAARERRLIVYAIDVAILLVGAAMLYVSTGDAHDEPPTTLLWPVAVILVVLAGCAWTFRRKLAINQFHRLMLRLAAVATMAVFLGRLFAVVTGQSPEQTLMLGMVSCGAVAAALALFVAPFMAAIAVTQLAGAALIASGQGPFAVIDVAVQTLSALLVCRAWSRSGSGYYMRLTTVDDRARPNLAVSVPSG